MVITALLIQQSGAIQGIGRRQRRTARRNNQDNPGALLRPGLNRQGATQVLRALVHSGKAQMPLALAQYLGRIKALPVVAYF
jgi:hypothetical protein